MVTMAEPRAQQGPDDFDQDPIERFERHLAEAREIDRERLPEPTAMTLATVGDDGKPSARIVLLKDVSVDGFVFYTNTRSRKGREIGGHPYVALCFHWQALEIQVRVEGVAKVVSEGEADAYFASRPRQSQLGAWASDQSETLSGLAELDRRLSDAELRFRDVPVPRPPHWSGFRVDPARIEFWYNRPYRMHERVAYVRERERWRVTRLFP
jgi:pyridoxamine 5'-phosphate oxidase